MEEVTQNSLISIPIFVDKDHLFFLRRLLNYIRQEVSNTLGLYTLKQNDHEKDSMVINSSGHYSCGLFNIFNYNIMESTKCSSSKV